MQLAIDEASMEQLIDQVMIKRGYVPAEQLQGRTIGINEFTKKYCYPHGKDWVKKNILYKFKPDWVQNLHPGPGHRFAIFEYDASLWMQKHQKEIDWNGE